MPPIPMVLLMCAAALSAEPEPQRLTLAQASEKVAETIRQAKPTAQIAKSFAVEELSTDDIWKQLRVQVVKVKDENVERGESFVLHNGKIIPIGRAVGGDGVTSLQVADVVGDKQPLLIFAFAWGSGQHRSEIGVLDLHGKEPRVLALLPVNFLFDDYALRQTDKGDVQVWQGEKLVGQVTVQREKGELTATIKSAP